MKRELSKIGDLATYVNGYAFKPSDWSLKGRPIIRIQDLTGNDYQTNYYEGTLDERYKIKKGDLLISWSASIGVYEWEKEDAWLNQHIFKVVFDKDVAINKKYFQYAVGNALQKVSGLVHGSTMKHLTKGVFDAIQVPLYSIGNQQEIVQRLETIQRSIELVEREKQQLETLVKSRFIEMFGDPVTNPMGWEVKKLKDISRKISDGVHAKPEYTGEGTPFLSVVNINKGKVDFSNCKFVSQSDYEKMIKSTNPEKGDVLYTKVGATYGIPAYVDTDEKFCLYVSVCLIKPRHELVNARFLTESMRLPYIKHQADRRIRGIGVPDLHLNQISEFDVLCPPMELQERYIDFVTQVDKSKSVLQNLLEKQELLRAALMQEYFG